MRENELKRVNYIYSDKGNEKAIHCMNINWVPNQRGGKLFIKDLTGTIGKI